LIEKLILIGRVTRDPEMRYTPSGTAVTNFTVATSTTSTADECPKGWKEGYQGKGWQVTKFWRVTAWRKLAENCNEYVRKGSLVYVEGEMTGVAEDGVINPRLWEGNDGVWHANFEVRTWNVRFLQTPRDEQSEYVPDIDEEEIPF
jgi:single-strand DNA-binding protein